MVILLVLNVIMLAICGVLALRMGSVSDELANLRNDTEMIKMRTAVQAGMAYMGPNKRPVRYMMILDYSDPHSPKLNPQKEITKPIED